MSYAKKLTAALHEQGIPCRFVSEWDYDVDGEIAIGPAVYVQVGHDYAIVNTWSDDHEEVTSGDSHAHGAIERITADILAQLAEVAKRSEG